MSEETETESEGGSGKVFLILGLLVGVAVGGGGGYFMSGDDEAEATGNSKTEKKVAKPRDPLISVPFERISIPIYAERGNSRRFIGNYFVDVDVQVSGETNQIAVKRSISQLTHGFISAISKANLMSENNPTELDLDKAAKVLKKRADSIMGKGIVSNVVITEAVRMPR